MSGDWGTHDFATLPEDRKEWCAICDERHVPPYDCLKKLRIRAEAAEKELDIDSRARIETLLMLAAAGVERDKTGCLLNHLQTEYDAKVQENNNLEQQLAEAQQQIEWLERLVPDASTEFRLRDFAENGAISFDDEWMEPVWAVLDAIRKYREGN